MPTNPELHRPSLLTDAVMAGIMLALALGVQNFRLPNPVTGILVNAIFLVTLARGSLRCALLLAGLTPVGALLTGHLPAPLILLAPVIVPGNVVYIALAAATRRWARLAEALAASVAKALLIGVGGFLLADSMGWPPEIRLLLGGITGIQIFTGFVGVLLGEALADRLQPRSGR